MFSWNTLKASRGRETLNIRSLFSNSFSRHEIWGLFGSQNSSCDLVGFYTMQSCKWKCWCSPARLRSLKIQNTTVPALTLTLVKCEPTYEVYWNTSKSLSAVRCQYSVTSIQWSRDLWCHCRHIAYYIYRFYFQTVLVLVKRNSTQTHTHMRELQWLIGNVLTL